MKKYSVIFFFCLPLSAAEVTTQGPLFEWGIGGGTAAGRTAAMALTNVVLVSANSDWSLALRSNGTLFAWGNNSYGQTNVPAGSNYRHCQAGWRHGIACDWDGKVIEWGVPFGHSISDWTNLWPVAMASKTIVQVAAGDDHSAALASDGTVFAWGGRAAVTNKNGIFTTARNIASGWYNLLINFNNGTITNFGQISQGGQYWEAETKYGYALTNIAFVACSQFSSYAIQSNGFLHAWGMPDDTYGFLTTPAAATNLVSVSGGRYHTVAASSNGTVFAWGDNAQGQINIPAGLTNSIFVSAGRYTSQAIQRGSASGGGDPPTALRTIRTPTATATTIQFGQ